MPAVITRLRAAGCVFAEDEARLLVEAAQSPGDLAAMVGQRVGGRPLEQVLGWAEFCGIRMVVAPGVFVPRRRTELLVREGVALLSGTRPRDVPVVLDLCCGCGAIGAAVAAAVGAVELHAVDTDPAAVTCAERNVAAAGGRVYEGDLYAPLPASLRGRVNVLVANAPYVPTDAIATMPPEARLHERPAALDGGADGLDVQRRVIDGAPAWLAPDGHVLLETSEHQVTGTVDAYRRGGLIARVVRSDELDATVVVGARVD
jgi:release factor glutamine methyltransferase